MKFAGILSVLVVTGCAPSSTPPPVGGGPTNPDPSSPTDWPRGDDSPAPERVAYPFILAHGLDGFKNIGPVDYFSGVQDALVKDGRQVFVSAVDAYNSSEVRGAQLQTFVEGVLLETGADKANLICHSQGGFDCRFVASAMPDRIASVTTIATPHHGTPIADLAESDQIGPASDAVNAFLDVVGAVVDGISGHSGSQQDAKAALQLMTTQGSLDFTAKHPDSPKVAYFSVAGRTGTTGDDACGSPTEVPFISKYDSVTVSASAALAASAAIVSGSYDPAPTNDGLVPAASARWGMFLGCLPADHLGEMCWKSTNGMDCVQFYRDLATWLVARGY